MTIEQEVLKRLEDHENDWATQIPGVTELAHDLAVGIERSWRETGVINWEHKWDEGYAAAIAAFVGGDEGLKIRDWGEG